MNSKYTFQTEFFALNENGLHLLRSGYNYQSYTYSEIESVDIKRGKPIKNWLFLFLFGAACILFALYYLVYLYEFFTSIGGRIYVEQIVVPIIPAFAGIASLWVSLKNADILVVNAPQKRLVLELTDLVKKNEAQAFINYLNQYLGPEKIKHSIDISSKAIVA